MRTYNRDMNNAANKSNAQYTNEEWYHCMIDFQGGRPAEQFFGRLVRDYFEVKRLTGDLANQVCLRRHENKRFICCNLPASIIDVIGGPMQYFASQNGWYFDLYCDSYTTDDYVSAHRVG